MIPTWGQNDAKIIPKLWVRGAGRPGFAEGVWGGQQPPQFLSRTGWTEPDKPKKVVNWNRTEPEPENEKSRQSLMKSVEFQSPDL